jgi:hypothetical protein
MGANAQTTVPSLLVGQVLTADQQNQSARTGVPVFATPPLSVTQRLVVQAKRRLLRASCVI